MYCTKAERLHQVTTLTRKVDVRLPEKGNSNFHGARPVHLIIMMIKWIQTSRLSINLNASIRTCFTFSRTRQLRTAPTSSASFAGATRGHRKYFLLSLSLTLAHSRSLTHSLSLSHTHTHTLSHTLSLTHTFSLLKLCLQRDRSLLTTYLSESTLSS